MGTPGRRREWISSASPASLVRSGRWASASSSSGRCSPSGCCPSRGSTRCAVSATSATVTLRSSTPGSNVTRDPADDHPGAGRDDGHRIERVPHRADRGSPDDARSDTRRPQPRAHLHRAIGHELYVGPCTLDDADPDSVPVATALADLGADPRAHPRADGSPSSAQASPRAYPPADASAQPQPDASAQPESDAQPDALTFEVTVPDTYAVTVTRTDTDFDAHVYTVAVSVAQPQRQPDAGPDQDLQPRRAAVRTAADEDPQAVSMKKPPGAPGAVA